MCNPQSLQLNMTFSKLTNVKCDGHMRILSSFSSKTQKCWEMAFLSMSRSSKQTNVLFLYFLFTLVAIFLSQFSIISTFSFFPVTCWSYKYSIPFSSSLCEGGGEERLFWLINLRIYPADFIFSLQKGNG